MNKEKRLTKNDLKRQAIIDYHAIECQTYSMTVAVEHTAKAFYLSESRIWQILREENKPQPHGAVR